MQFHTNGFHPGNPEIAKVGKVGIKLAYTTVIDDNDFPGTLGGIFHILSNHFYL